MVKHTQDKSEQLEIDFEGVPDGVEYWIENEANALNMKSKSPLRSLVTTLAVALLCTILYWDISHTSPQRPIKKDVPHFSKLNIAHFIQEWPEDKKKADHLIDLLTDSAKIKRLKSVTKEPLQSLAESVSYAWDPKTKTASVNLNGVLYTFTDKECAELFLMTWAICQDRPVAKTKKDYLKDKEKLLIDFYQEKPVGRQIKSIIEQVKTQVALIMKEQESSIPFFPRDMMQGAREIPKGVFVPVDIKDSQWNSISEASLYVPDGFSPAHWQLNIFFCGMWISADHMQRHVFKIDKLMPDQAYCILNWNYSYHWNPKPSAKIDVALLRSEERYHEAILHFKELITHLNFFLWWVPKKVYLIGHSAWVTIVNTIAWMEEHDSRLSCVAIDGVYGPTQATHFHKGEIYCVSKWTGNSNGEKDWIPIKGLSWSAWEKHLGIVPKVLEDLYILKR